MQSIGHNVSTTPDRPAAGVLENAAGWFFAIGVVQILLGIFGVTFGFIATVVNIVALGFLLIGAGTAQLGAAIWARDWRWSILYVLLAPLYAFVGVITLRHPVLGAEALMLMLAAMLMVLGCFRMIGAVADRPPGWGLLLMHGFVTLLPGILIWWQWP